MVGYPAIGPQARRDGARQELDAVYFHRVGRPFLSLGRAGGMNASETRVVCTLCDSAATTLTTSYAALTDVQTMPGSAGDDFETCSATNRWPRWVLRFM